VVVAGLSLAVNSQGQMQGARPVRDPRPARSSHPGQRGGPRPVPSGGPKRRKEDKAGKSGRDIGDLARRLLRGRRGRKRPAGEGGQGGQGVPGNQSGRSPGSPQATSDRLIERPFERPPLEPEAEILANLKPLSLQGRALVVSVVDERTLGPVTRSRLTLKVKPDDGESFEVTTRVAFPTPEARAQVKVGGTVPVRYDPADHRRVVVDVEAGSEG
jgi:hypothetical protein